ncbi:unnamed protein product [Calypogeia fissa]
MTGETSYAIDARPEKPKRAMFVIAVPWCLGARRVFPGQKSGSFLTMFFATRRSVPLVVLEAIPFGGAYFLSPRTRHGMAESENDDLGSIRLVLDKSGYGSKRVTLVYLSASQQNQKYMVEFRTEKYSTLRYVCFISRKIRALNIVTLCYNSSNLSPDAKDKGDDAGQGFKNWQ